MNMARSNLLLISKSNVLHLWVVAKLVMKSLPGALVRICNGDVVCIGQLSKPLPHQGNAALEQRQHCIPKIESLLHTIQNTFKLLQIHCSDHQCVYQRACTLGQWWSGCLRPALLIMTLLT